jgi:hypothetical protein
VSAIVLSYAVGWDRGTLEEPEPVTIGVKGAVTSVAKPPPPAVAAQPANVPSLSAFVLTAVHGESWLDVRSGSVRGRTLYAGLVPAGGTVRFRAKRLWVRFGAASNVRLRIDGERTPLPAFGTFDAFVGPRGVVADRTDHATAAQSP